MDIGRIKQIAREHKTLIDQRETGKHPESDDARLAEARALDELWQEIDRACANYCTAYNGAFGTVRIRSERHADTVVIRAEADEQDTLVFHRIRPSDTHRGNIEAHRYHFAAQPVHLPVGLRYQSAGATMTLREQDVTVDELVFELLSTFGEQIARADQRRARAVTTDA